MNQARITLCSFPEATECTSQRRILYRLSCFDPAPPENVDYGFRFHSENEDAPISRSTIAFGLPERTVRFSVVTF